MIQIKKKVVISVLMFCIHLTGCGQDRSDTVSTICDNPYPSENTSVSTHSDWARDHYPKRIHEFKADPIKSGGIVMIGNSLTEQGENWSKRLTKEDVFNRGISGDTSEGVLARLDEIICKTPSKVFVMIGTNDLWSDLSPQRIHAQIMAIAQRLVGEIPNVEVYVQTIMPLEANHEKSDKLEQINTLIRSSVPLVFHVIDTNLELADANNSLSSDLTTDGVHLTESGYVKWANFLKKYI